MFSEADPNPAKYRGSGTTIARDELLDIYRRFTHLFCKLILNKDIF